MYQLKTLFVMISDKLNLEDIIICLSSYKKLLQINTFYQFELKNF